LEERSGVREEIGMKEDVGFGRVVDRVRAKWVRGPRWRS
jgi:hypothetical protein